MQSANRQAGLSARALPCSSGTCLACLTSSGAASSGVSWKLSDDMICSRCQGAPTRNQVPATCHMVFKRLASKADVVFQLAEMSTSAKDISHSDAIFVTKSDATFMTSRRVLSCTQPCLTLSVCYLIRLCCRAATALSAAMALSAVVLLQCLALIDLHQKWSACPCQNNVS